MTTSSRVVVFSLVGALGVACQLLVLHLLVGAGIAVSLSTAVAVITAVAHNFLWHRRWTWRDRSAAARVPARVQLARFVGFNGLVSLAGNVVLTTGLASAGAPVMVANLAAVVVCSVINFLLADRAVFLAVALMLMASAAEAAGPGPRTLDGWQEYVAATERRIAVEEPNRAAGAPTEEEWRRLRAGQLLVSPQRASRPDGAAIEVDAGAVHHWVGRVFLPGVELQALLAELQAPTSRRWLPAEVRSLRVAGDEGGGLRVFMRVERNSLVDVTYDIEHRVWYARHPAGHATSRSYSRRIAQIDDPGTPAERHVPDGQDLGFLWRLHAYWRYVPVAGGVLVECESLALSRSVPSLLRPVAGPIVARVSRESLENTLRALRSGFRA